MMESFFQFQIISCRKKNIENTQFLTLSIQTFPITNLEKSLCHLDLPIDIKNYYISFSS